MTGRQALRVASPVLALAIIAVAPAPAQDVEDPEPRTPQTETPAASEDPDAPTPPPPPSHKAGYRPRAGFGGPNSAEGQLEEDDRVTTPAFRFGLFDRVMEPWFDWKRGVNERTGFQLSGHYVALYQGLSDSLTDEDYAASGLLRLTTKWTLLGKGTNDTGSLVVMFDHRHNFTKIAPPDLGSQAGYIGQTAVLVNDADLVLPNINWQQGFRDGHAGLIVGRFDPNDYINVLGISDPWRAFQNLAIILDASVAFPDTSYGIGGGSYLGESWYVLGTLNDANGTMTDYGFFDGGAELFSAAEVGWSPTKADRYTKNVNLTFWHVDQRVEAGVDSAHGVALAANWTFDKRLMPFLRAGWSEGLAPIYNRSLTAGIVYALTRRSDLTGIAVNWGDTSDDTLKDQITIEGFYRLQFAQNLALTAGGQLLIDPALNPETDQIWLLSLRARVTF